MSRQRRLLSTAAVVGFVFVASVQPAGSSVQATPDTVPEREASSADDREPEIDLVIAEFAETKGISHKDAQLAFDLATPILDFVERYRDDPEFGSIWVTYDGRTEVHARVAMSSDADRALDDLETSLGVTIERVASGGSSWAALHNLARLIFEQELNVGYSINHELGTFDVYEGAELLAALDVDAEVRQVSPPDHSPEPNASPSAGDSARYSGAGWQPVCTAGFMYEGAGFQGFATAGHCPDGRYYVYGAYSVSGNTLRYESCSTDIQMKDFSGTHTLTEVIREPQLATAWILLNIAGGYYVGQPTLAVGSYTNPIIGSGSAVGFGSWSFPGAGDCPAATKGTFVYSGAANPGDSGGPVALWYNNSWYLASTHIGDDNTNSIGTWVNWISIPGGGHVCYSNNPC